MSVNAIRKQSTDEEVTALAKSLIKSWKKLLGNHKVPPLKNCDSLFECVQMCLNHDFAGTDCCVLALFLIVPQFTVCKQAALVVWSIIYSKSMAYSQAQTSWTGTLSNAIDQIILICNLPSVLLSRRLNPEWQILLYKTNI